MSTTAPDRRTRRRQQTIDEILDVAIELMEAEGVAALSLSAVARRLGMQPPSLYQYFPSKMAIYDALFQRGAEQFLAAQRDAIAAATTDDVVELHLIGATAFSRWCDAEPGLSHSCCSGARSPGSSPAGGVRAGRQEALADIAGTCRQAVDAGRLHPDAASEEGIALFTSMTAGVLSQQMANEPDATFEEGRFTRLMPVVLEMFYQHYAPTRGKKMTRSTRGADRAGRQADSAGVHRDAELQAWHDLLASLDGARVAAPYGLHRVGCRGHRRPPDAGRPRTCQAAVVVPAAGPSRPSGSTRASPCSTHT